MVLCLVRGSAGRIEVSRSLAVKDTLVSRFNDGEMFLEVPGIADCGDADFLLIQSSSHPANDNLIELFLAVNAVNAHRPASLHLLMPYYGYARQDRRISGEDAVNAEVVARILSSMPIDTFIFFDLHSPGILNYFPEASSRNILPEQMFVNALSGLDIFGSGSIFRSESALVVAPDIGAVARARSLALALYDRPDICYIHKSRESAGKSSIVEIIGEVKDKICIITDDIMDSGGTLLNAATALKKRGAEGVVACITHPVFAGLCSGNISEKTLSVLRRINNSELDALVVSDSIGCDVDFALYSRKIHKASIWDNYYDVIIGSVNR